MAGKRTNETRILVWGILYYDDSYELVGAFDNFSIQILRTEDRKMDYRLARVGDVPQIEELCKRENIADPISGMTYVAEDEDKIIGVINFRPVHLVDCFISEYPLSSNVLYEKMISALEVAGIKRVLMFPKNKEIEVLGLKKGFRITNICINTMEKEL